MRERYPVLPAMNPLLLQPARGLAGSLRLPGDKSISHRYAMLAAIASGRTRLADFSAAADCAGTLQCLRALGVEVKQEGGKVEIAGRGPRLEPASASLDCGNSGSTMRMLAGILAGQPFETELTGDASLLRRPMARVAEPLRAMGARVDTSDGGRPPLRILGGPLRALDYRLPVASAQVKTAILFAALYADGETVVEEPLRTRDHGELAVRAFGAQLTRERASASAPQRVRIAGGQPLHALDAVVPGDISSAAFFLCAAALFPGSSLVLDAVLLNPTRAAILDVLASMGARIDFLNLEEHHGELVGTIRLEGGSLRGATITGAQTAALIDELPVLAAIAPFSEQGVEIRDAAELRLKESDRIAAIAANLRALGAQVEELPDGLRVPGRQQLRGGEVDPAGDHRIAMAFAVAALRASGPTRIHHPEVVSVSYPDFFSGLDSLAER